MYKLIVEDITMIHAKQIEIRSNIKKYFDMAYEGTPIVVPRKENKNVVIISEEEYARLGHLERILAYSEAFKNNSDCEYLSKSSTDDIKTENLDKLYAIGTLEHDWNGNGAPALPRELIDKVRSILSELVIQPEIFPTALQTIQLEYDNSRKDHMEIEIGIEESAEIFLVSHNGTETIETIPSNSKSINERVGKFYG